MKRFITRKRINYKKTLVIIILIFLIIMIRAIIYKKENSKKYERLIDNVFNMPINNEFNIELSKVLEPTTIIRNIIKEYQIVYPINNKNNDDPNKEPIIYIYNTHQSEEYISDSLSNYNITPTVYIVSNILKKELEKYNIYSVVEDESIKEILSNNNWQYKDSYKASRELLNKTKDKYPTIKYYLDLHRDSISSTTTINDKEYAKMMFVLGMNHTNYEKNEKLMLNINNYLENKYPSVMKNMLYANKNIFNQDFNENCFLIEIGGNKNTLEEVYNSTLILAEAISFIINGEI